MNKTLKYILFGIFLAAFCTGTFLLVREERAVRHEISCNAISIQIPDDTHFITEEIAYSFISERFSPMIGMRLTEIDLDHIESTFESQDCISNAEAWVTDDGILHITLFQKTPALRFFDKDREFYVDGEGNPFLCMNPEWQADVPSVSGAVIIARDREWLDDMMRLVSSLEKNRTCMGHIVEYVTDSEGFIHILLHGGATVDAGLPGNAADIIQKMECYFRNIEGIYGNSYYKKVNIKYKDQIICRKDS